MVAAEQKKKASQRKPQFVKNLNHFKLSNHEQRMVTREAILCIVMLKLKIEALQKEYEDFKIIKKEPFHKFQEVKVEQIEEMFKVQIRSLKGQKTLVNILEAFEEMGLSVAQASASSLDSFSMDAIVGPQSKDKLCSVGDLTQTLVKALGKPSAPM